MVVLADALPSEPVLHAALHPALRLLIAAVLAGAVGWERERAGKAAGLRTHVIVALAAALYGSLVDVMLLRYAHAGGVVGLDPTRAIQAVATGIGFLGGGIIFVAGSGSRVKGLTTAATVWATAALGLAVGLEAYLLAVTMTGLMLAVLRGLARFDLPDADDAGG